MVRELNLASKNVIRYSSTFLELDTRPFLTLNSLSDKHRFSEQRKNQRKHSYMIMSALTSTLLLRLREKTVRELGKKSYLGEVCIQLRKRLYKISFQERNSYEFLQKAKRFLLLALQAATY